MSDGAAAFELGSFNLQSGRLLRDAKLVYRVYGRLAPDRSNVVLYPTSYGAQHADIDWLIQPMGILDPRRWFVIIVNMFGNGLSTSPSHMQDDAADFAVTHHDNVGAQDRLLREVFGVEELALVYGWSMGAQQAYHWAVLHPERVRCVAALCGTARTSEHNLVFLRSLEAALKADPTWDGTRFVAAPERGIRAFARIYASWAASQAFYRRRLYRDLGYADLEDYLLRSWEASYRRRHPADLLAMLETWMACDVAANPRHRGDLATALGSIRARVLVMPSATDLYFTPDDCAADAAAIPGARLLPIPSIWGHRAGNPYQNPEDASFIRNAIEELTAR
jgi:homoserine O-acetyltransferase